MIFQALSLSLNDNFAIGKFVALLINTKKKKTFMYTVNIWQNILLQHENVAVMINKPEKYSNYIQVN